MSTLFRSAELPGFGGTWLAGSNLPVKDRCYRSGAQLRAARQASELPGGPGEVKLWLSDILAGAPRLDRGDGEHERGEHAAEQVAERDTEAGDHGERAERPVARLTLGEAGRAVVTAALPALDVITAESKAGYPSCEIPPSDLPAMRTIPRYPAQLSGKHFICSGLASL
jgi:hypothetical protein